MGGPLPVLPQRVVGIQGTAGMVHPSTGYMVARTLAAAPIVANSIVRCLGSDRRSLTGDDLSAEVWKYLWPIERRRQREFFCFGMDIRSSLTYKALEGFLTRFLIWNLIIGMDSCHQDCFYLSFYFLGSLYFRLLLMLLG
ncbi:hypothetical protein QYF36_002446 [Acer negundo]|nr:hypothetical protein QYF36_002446 [Acer negundo]